MDSRSGRDDMPDLLDVVAGLVAWLGVFDEQVQGLAPVGPLFGAIVAGDDAEVVLCLGVGGRRQRRPGLGALVIASALALRVFVKSIKRHAGAVDQHAILGFDCLGVGAGREQGGAGNEQRCGGSGVHGVPFRVGKWGLPAIDAASARFIPCRMKNLSLLLACGTF